MSATTPDVSSTTPWGDVRLFPVVAAAALGVGGGIGSGHGLIAAGFVVIAVAVMFGLWSWRWSLYALLLYIPISGLPIIATYPDTHVAVLLKDILFLLPAYLGFLVWAAATRSKIVFRGAPIIPLLLLALLVLSQALNPSLPNLTVGAIGVKVWLLYVPLYFLGYHLVRDRSDLVRLLTVMAVSGVLPLALGIAEAILLTTGYRDVVYKWYGDAASAVTQDFTQFNYAGGGTLRRVPSTFSSVTQYSAFATSMVVVVYAWRHGASIGGKGLRGQLLWALALIAAFLSGARGAFLLVPLLVLLILLLDQRGGLLRLSGRMIGLVIALLAAFASLGVATSAVVRSTLNTATVEFHSIFVEGLQSAIGITWLGLGTGIDTNASRYAFSQPEFFQGVGGTWYESWWVKVVLELGVPGLALVLFVFAMIIGRAWRQHRTLRDPQLRAISAALLAFLIWSLAYGVKGGYLDVDPTNVYFWLFAGIGARLLSFQDDLTTNDTLRPSLDAGFHQNRHGPREMPRGHDPSRFSHLDPR